MYVRKNLQIQQLRFTAFYATIASNIFSKGGFIMTELETMQRAKMYMDQLAQGIDPISGQEMPEDSCLNNVRLARCFFYVSGVLDQVIRNGGQVRAARKSKFSITSEQLQRVQLSPVPIRISEFTAALMQVAGTENTRQLSAVTITNWLADKGFLASEPTSDGKSRRVPTAAGRNVGMSTQMRQSPNGEYLAIYYDTNAQQFLLDNLPGILKEK